MRYMVLGSEGFLGRSVCRELLLHTRESIIKLDRVMPVRDNPRFRCFKTDTSRTGEILKLCDRLCPDIVFNFSGTYETACRDTLFRINCFAPIEFLEQSRGRRFRLVLMGSAAEYGESNRMVRIKESAPLAPVSDYGVSKACQTLMALRIAKKSPWPQVIIARGFNLIGPGMSDRFFLGAFALQIARIEKGLQPPVIRVGNLESFRDLLPVASFSRYIRILSGRCAPSQAYNICTGRATKVGSVLENLLKLSSVKNIAVISRKDNSQSRDIRWSVGDCSKLSRFIKVSVSEGDLMDTFRKTLDWYRDKAGRYGK